MTHGPVERMSLTVSGLQTSVNDSHESDGGCLEEYDDVPPVMGMGEGSTGLSEHQPSLAPCGAPMSSNGSPGSCESKREQIADQAQQVVTPKHGQEHAVQHVGGSSSSASADEGANGSVGGVGADAPFTPVSGPKSIKDITISWLGGKKAKSPSKRSPSKAAAAVEAAAQHRQGMGATAMSESSEEEGSDGQDDRDEVESMAQLLLDPVKTRQAVTSGICSNPSHLALSPATKPPLLNSRRNTTAYHLLAPKLPTDLLDYVLYCGCYAPARSDFEPPYRCWRAGHHQSTGSRGSQPHHRQPVSQGVYTHPSAPPPREDGRWQGPVTGVFSGPHPHLLKRTAK